MELTLPLVKVFGQNNIVSLDTYFEYVKKGRDNQLEIKVSGPDYYDNEMVMEGYDEKELLKAFQPSGYMDRDTGKMKTCEPNASPVKTIDDLGGHSVTAFYQEAKLIGFQRR